MKVIDGFVDRNIHYRWDNKTPPIEKVSSGECISISIPDSSTKQIKKDHTTAELKRIDESMIDGIVGPIYVEEAKPGDTIKIAIKKIIPGNWGWTAIFSKFGLLGNMFDDRLIIWDIENGYAISATDGFLDEVKLPIKPFLGITGTAPSIGKYPVIPPQHFGGNMDNRYLSEGSVLYLPVGVEGAMVSFGDPHALQGDGEVCGSAIETSSDLNVEIEVLKEKKTRSPFIESTENEVGKVVVSTGISLDIKSAVREAVINMIESLMGNGYEEAEAYVLCSVMGKLHISEAVDMPNYLVSMSINKDILFH